MDLITLALARQGGGTPGAPGKDGLSAYEIAKKDGFDGTEEEWLESLYAQVNYATDDEIKNIFSEVIQ